MGLKDTGTVNDAATAGAGRGTGSRGTPITRDPWDTGPRNPNSFFGPGQGSNYVPAKIGAYATPEPYRRNKTDLKITLTPDPVSGGGVATIPNPWQPKFIINTETIPNSYKVRFNLGTVNQVPATNWNDEHTLSSDEEDIKFVILTISTNSGKVSGVAISVEANAPDEDEISKDVPPVAFKVVLGAITNNTSKMIVTDNIQAAAVEVFRQGKSAPTKGSESFTRWWRWQVTTS